MISRLKSSENSCPPSITVLTEVNVKSSSFAIRKKNNKYAEVTTRCSMLKKEKKHDQTRELQNKKVRNFRL